MHTPLIWPQITISCTMSIENSGIKSKTSNFVAQWFNPLAMDVVVWVFKISLTGFFVLLFMLIRVGTKNICYISYVQFKIIHVRISRKFSYSVRTHTLHINPSHILDIIRYTAATVYYFKMSKEYSVTIVYIWNGSNSIKSIDYQPWYCEGQQPYFLFFECITS